jgi:hypothetical protein
MDAVPPPMPSLDAAVPGPPGPPVDLLAIAAEEIPTPPVADILAPPVAAKEAKFGSVDIGAWDSNWGDTWSESADVFEPSDPGHVPEAIQEMVAWQTGDEAVPVTMSQVPLPSTATLKRMKKGELADLAKARKVDGSGTKAEIIARLLK